LLGSKSINAVTLEWFQSLLLVLKCLLSVLKTFFWHVSLGEKFLTFWRIIIPFWPWRWRHYHFSKRWELFTQQHIVTTQMTWILSNTIFRMLNLPVQFIVATPQWMFTVFAINSVFTANEILYYLHEVCDITNAI